MIEYSNIQRLDNIPFEEYLQIDGCSHSFLKREQNGIVPELKITENIIIGKLVDAILTEPEKADMLNPCYPVAREIAIYLKGNFGNLIDSFQKQVSYVADLTHKGFTMRSTGRLDFLLPRHSVIDLKVTFQKNIPELISFMGYKNQVWHYAKMAGLKKAYLLIYSVPLKKAILNHIDCSSDENYFWQEKIIMHGKVLVNETTDHRL